MNKKEHIRLVNRVKVSMMAAILRDIQPDADGVITTEGRLEMLQTLSNWEGALFDLPGTPDQEPSDS